VNGCGSVGSWKGLLFVVYRWPVESVYRIRGYQTMRWVMVPPVIHAPCFHADASCFMPDSRELAFLAGNSAGVEEKRFSVPVL
jgi:hypothetical protein